MRFAKRRLIGAAGLAAAAMWLQAVPAAAHPTVDVANPQPGDRVIAGSVIMEGLAWDHDAQEGTGVERVSVRVCGLGGAFLGDATLGMPSTSSVKNGSRYILNAGWRIKANLHGAGDARELCITARSSVTGTDTLVRVPITIGTAPPPPPAPTEPPTDICTINPEECGPDEPAPAASPVTVATGGTGTTGGTGGTTAPATGGTSATGGSSTPGTGTGTPSTTGGTGATTAPPAVGTGGAGSGTGGTGIPGSGGPTDPCVIDPEDPICP